MRQVALVVQRYGKDVLGGAETLARVLANALADAAGVTVLTTTARDHRTWEAYYPEGESCEEGIKILRFRPDFGRLQYFHELNRILLAGTALERFFEFNANQKRNWQKHLSDLPIGFQEEFVKWQGPYSSSLYDYLEANWADYDATVFVTYLYPTTYFGVERVGSPDRVFICPTLHDEPYSYLSVLRKYAAYRLLFLTEEEMNLATTLWGRVNGRVIGYGLADRGASFVKNRPAGTTPYLLYAGRIEPAKGAGLLLDYFRRYKQEYPTSPVKLRLLGHEAMDLEPEGKYGIEAMGFVDEEEKLRLIAGALAFVNPSAYESLSIVILEAFMVGTPVLVNGYSPVLAGHVNRSGGGFTFSDYYDFARAIDRLVNNPSSSRELGRKGRDYFTRNYEWSAFKQQLLQALQGNSVNTADSKARRLDTIASATLLK